MIDIVIATASDLNQLHEWKQSRIDQLTADKYRVIEVVAREYVIEDRLRFVWEIRFERLLNVDRSF